MYVVSTTNILRDHDHIIQNSSVILQCKCIARLSPSSSIHTYIAVFNLPNVYCSSMYIPVDHSAERAQTFHS